MFVKRFVHGLLSAAMLLAVASMAPGKPPQKAADKPAKGEKKSDSGKAASKKHAPAKPPAKKFLVLDAMNYGQPDTRKIGMIPTSCFGQGEFFPGMDGHKSHDLMLEGKLPDKQRFIAAVQKHAKEKPGPIVLDIEKVFLTGDPKVVDPRLTMFTTMAQWAKQAVPGRQVGYWSEYDIYPERVDRKNRDKAKELARTVGALFPHLYVSGDNREAFRGKLKHVLEQAHRMAPGTPVYPFIWPQYRGCSTTKELRLKFVSGDYWRWQLETVRESGAEGVVLWGWKGHAKTWDPQAAWWQETQKFMESLKHGRK